MGKLEVTQDSLCHMTNRFRTLANGRVVASLEGGYNFEMTSKAVEAVIRVRYH